MTREARETVSLAPPSSGLVTAQSVPVGRKLWTVAVLSVIAFLAATDRNILAVLLVPIQKDLRVNDAAMGALTGTAFALVYATTALPLAWVADRSNRRNILALAVAFWSAMTALSGLARSYTQLLFARFGVAAGEAAQGPAGLSLLADLYPAADRGTAISATVVGSALGFSVGAFVAGALNDRYGWNAALLAVGLPGLAVALATWLSIPEPKRGAQDFAPAQVSPVSVLTAARTLIRIRSLRPLFAGIVFLNMAFLGWLNWLPAFLMRVHDLSTTGMSAVFALTVGLGGVLSNLFAGAVSDRLARRGPRWRMYYCCAMTMVALPFVVAGLLIAPTAAAVVCIVLYSIAAGGLTTVTYAAVVGIAPSNLRASTIAVMNLAISVFGGLGPLFIGLLNDGLKPALGVLALRYTLMVTPIGLALAGVMFLIASRSIDADSIASPASQAAS